jgi:hypothetical protein
MHKRYVVSCFASSFSSSLGSFIESQALASGLCFLCPCFVVTTMVALPGFLVVVLNMLLWWPLLHHIFSFSKVKTAFDRLFITWDVLVVYPSRVAHYHCVFIYSGCDFRGYCWQPITAKQEFVQCLKVESNYGSHSCHASIKSIVVEFCVLSHRYVEPLWNLQSCIHFILCSLSICVYFVCHPFSLCVPRKSQPTHLK